MLFPALSENQNEISVLRLRLSEVRDELDLSASDNTTAPSLPILLSGLCEHEVQRHACYC
jgi:hypothetical protein